MLADRISCGACSNPHSSLALNQQQKVLELIWLFFAIDTYLMKIK
jgi:hypothetical protein